MNLDKKYLLILAYLSLLIEFSSCCGIGTYCCGFAGSSCCACNYYCHDCDCGTGGAPTLCTLCTTTRHMASSRCV